MLLNTVVLCYIKSSLPVVQLRCIHAWAGGGGVVCMSVFMCQAECQPVHITFE